MTWKYDLKKALIENRSKRDKGHGTIYWDSVVDTVERFMRRFDKENEDRNSRRSIYWEDMVEILDREFPKGHCSERGEAIMMLAQIDRMLMGK